MTKNVSFFKTVKNFDEAVLGTVYMTTNFGTFTVLKFNRGCDNGIEQPRLQAFIKLFKEGKYFTVGFIHLFVNLKGVVIDGHHKLEMHKKLAEEGIIIPIVFTILPEPEFNTDDVVKLMGAIARFNAISSKWNCNSHFNTALKAELPLAVAISNIKAEFDNKYHIDGKIMTVGRIFGILTGDKKRIDSSLVSVEEFDNDKLLKKLESDEFLEDFRFAYEIMSIVTEMNKAVREKRLNPFHLVRVVFPLIWANEMNKVKFLNEVRNFDFQNVVNTTSWAAKYIQNVRLKFVGAKFIQK